MSGVEVSYEDTTISEINLDLAFLQDSSSGGSLTVESSIKIPTLPGDSENSSHINRTLSTPNLRPESVTFLNLASKNASLKPVSSLSQLTEVVLHSVFTRFVNLANSKIDSIRAQSLREEFRLGQLLSAEADTTFDEALISMGAIGRHCPELLVESLFTWRRLKASPKPSKEMNRHSRSQVVLSDRLNLAVDFILCRALAVLLEQLKLARNIDQCGGVLEAFSFNYLETLAPYLKLKSSNHQTMYSLIGDLIALLSNLRFASMSDRFIAELEQIPEEINSTIEKEDLVLLVIRTMKKLKLKIYPADSLEETAEFLLSCATFFRKTQHLQIKQAYAEAFVEMLLPIVPVVVAEVNFPVWAKAVDILYQKSIKLHQKPSFNQVVLPFKTTIIGVSQKEVFQKEWFGFFEQCAQRLKDRGLRSAALACLSRLLWIYLFRYPDPSPAAHKKLDSVFRMSFGSNRRLLSSSDMSLQHFYYMIYYVISWDQDYAMSSWLSPLLALEGLGGPSNYVGSGIDNIIPEKITIVLRAFLLMTSDVIKASRVPTFITAIDFNFTSYENIPTFDAIPKLEITLDSETESAIASKLHGFQRLLLEALDQLLPALELSYGSMLVNEEWCRASQLPPVPSTSLVESLSITSHTRDVSGDGNKNVYPHLAIFHIAYSKEKQPFFDLIISWLDGLPLLIPPGFSSPRTIDWVIRLILHIDPQVSQAAAAALNRLSCHLRLYIPVLRALSKLIQKIKVQFVEVLAPIKSDSPSSSEGLNLLKVFITILASWKKFLESSLAANAFNKEDPDAALNWSLIEETEAVGLLFLCCTFVPARRYALEILEMTSDIERTYEALIHGPDNNGHDSREAPSERCPIIDAIRSPEADVVISSLFSSSKNGSGSDEPLKSPTAYQVATLSDSETQGLWKNSFPAISKLIFEKSPITTVLCRHMASSRLKQLHSHILQLSETPDRPRPVSTNSRIPAPDEEPLTPDSIILEQWGRYLTFVCATITLSSDAQPEPIYAKKKDQRGSDKINSAKELFRLVFVLLSCENRKIRTMVVTSLCHINHNIYRNFIEDLQPFVRIVQEDTKSRCATRDFQNRRRQDRFREGIAECLAKTADTMLDQQYLYNHEISMQAITFLKDVYLFLGQPEVQADWAWQELRIYFCELVHKVYLKLILVGDAEDHGMPFELRHGLFLLAEKWCGHGSHRNSTRDREVNMMKEALERYTDMIARGARTLEMEGLRKQLEMASLNLMAVLCRGPIISTITSESFDLPGMFRWIESVLQSPDRNIYSYAHEALKSLLEHNLDNPLLYENVLHRCYAGEDNLNSTQSYFFALVDILSEVKSPPFTNGKKVVLIAYKCGDPSPLVRKAACRLLRIHWVASKTNISLEHDRLCERVVHPLAAIYEQAQVEVSETLAVAYPELIQEVFSEIIMRLSILQDNSLRSVFQVLIPWIHALRLTLERDDPEELSPISHGIVTNLLYLVVKYSDQFPADIERLWQALLSNITNAPALQAIVKFLIQINLEKRNPRLVFHTKNVFVYISHTQAGPQMLEYLMAKLTPTSMVPQKKTPSFPKRDRHKHLSTPLYVINIDDHILTHAKRPAFSPGQLVLIFLSDIVISFVSLTPHLPLLLHLGACQAFDAGLLPAVVKDLTQPILPNLLLLFVKESENNPSLAIEIHHLVTSYLSGKLSSVSSKSSNSDPVTEQPSPLEKLVEGVVETLSILAPSLVEQWCELASHWATVCPIRSVARASFNIYRSFTIPLRPKALVDIMSRLASTLSDLVPDIQNFAYEILHSLGSRVEDFRFSGWRFTPGLFWFLIGCLYGYNEAEFLQSLLLLKTVAVQLDVSDVAGIGQFLGHLPDQLYIPNIEDVIILGLSSAKAAPVTTGLILQFLEAPLCDLIVDPNKLRLGILIYTFPSLVDLTTIGDIPGKTIDSVELPCRFDRLLELSEESGCINLSKLLSNLPQQKFRSEEVCLRQLLQGLREGFFPSYEHECLLFSLGFLFPAESTLLRRRLKLVKLVVSTVHSDHHHFPGDRSGDVAPLLRLLEGPFAYDALEVVEDLLATATPIKTSSSQQANLGLWKADVEEEAEVKTPDTEKRSSLPLFQKDTAALASKSSSLWAVVPSEERQEATRLLIGAVARASASQLAAEPSPTPTSSVYFNSDNGRSTVIVDPVTRTHRHSSSLGLSNIIGTQTNQLLPQNSMTVLKDTRSVSPYQPPIMTDFYVEMGASPRSYHHYTTSSTSFSQRQYHQRHHSSSISNRSAPFHLVAQHNRNPSSVASLLDFYGISGCDPVELNELHSAISDLDGFFTSLNQTQEALECLPDEAIPDEST